MIAMLTKCRKVEPRWISVGVKQAKKNLKIEKHIKTNPVENEHFSFSKS